MTLFEFILLIIPVFVVQVYLYTFIMNKWIAFVDKETSNENIFMICVLLSIIYSIALLIYILDRLYPFLWGLLND